jgi:ABC-type branched-subunit amino acid transport system substrate-binding protein
MIRKRSPVGVILFFALLAIFAFSEAACRRSEESIDVTAVLPLTGPVALYGQSEQQGMTIAVDSVNSAGGIGGVRLNVRFEDSKAQAPDAVAAAQRAVSVHNVRFIVTSLTGPSRAVAPVAAKAGALQMVFATDEGIPEGFDRVIRLYPGIKEEGRTLLEYAKSDSSLSGH